MKKQLIITLSLIALGTLVLLSFSCTGGGPNTNSPNTTVQNNSGSNNTAPGSNTGSASPATNPCTVADLPGRRQAVEDDIRNEINNDPSLRDQLGNQSYQFNFTVREMNGKLEVIFTGKISGEGNSNGNNPKMQHFFNTFKKVLKRNCVEKVVFGSPARAKDSIGFEWNAACESPLVDCRGECVQVCNPVGGNTNYSNVNKNSNTNNSNSNKNSNTNTNSNANVNKP